MNVSINRLSTSRLSKAEMQAKNATESAFNSIRTLLNNSRAGAYYYFWLLKTCSINSSNSECPTFGGGKYGNQWPGYFNKGRFRDPSTLYWVDTNGEWCDGVSSPNCIGRQVAPSCSYLGKSAKITSIPWRLYSNSLDNLLNGQEKIINSRLTVYEGNKVDKLDIKDEAQATKIYNNIINSNFTVGNIKSLN